jgi:hypothetical protein
MGKNKWLDKFNPAEKIDRENFPLKGYLKAALFINLAVIILVIVFQGFLPPQVPLFYGLAEGEEQLASRIWLILPNLISLLTMIANLFLASLNKKDEFTQKILVFVAIAVTFLATVTTVRIALLVGSFL